MKTVILTIDGTDYKLATTLRVAYVLQGMNNHKPYLEIFQNVDKLPLEGQINFLYAAYTVACEDTPMTKEVFLNLCLDNLDLGAIMDNIKSIIEGITGKKLVDTQEKSVCEGSEAKN